jgi:hypothetical protein
MPKLLDRVRRLSRQRRHSRRTEQTYVFWIKRFIHFHRLRHPAEMGPEGVTAFLSHLASERVVLRKIYSDAEGHLRLFLRQRSERAKQQTSPDLSRRFRLIF